MEQASAPTRGLRLSLLEHRPDVRDALHRALSRQSAVEGVVAGDPALPDDVRAALVHDPHAVLIDPRGWRGVLDEVLDHQRKRGTFVVAAHVGYHMPGEEKELLSAGCSLYLLKGLAPGDLLGAVMAAVVRHLPPELWPLPLG